MIGGIQKLSLIDYPGKLSATVFLTRCNFRCPFCYSRELVLPEEIKKQPKISEKDFFQFLKERRKILEGVVICGGEPTIYKKLPDFIKKIKNMDFLIKLDTNGFNPDMLQKLIQLKFIDYVAMDVKAPKEKYSFYSGRKINLKKIEQAIAILGKGKVNFEFRTTVAPGLTKEDIKNLADWIAGENVKYFLQEFNCQKPILNPELLKLSFLKEKEIEEVIEEIKAKFKLCRLR